MTIKKLLLLCNMALVEIFFSQEIKKTKSLYNEGTYYG